MSTSKTFASTELLKKAFIQMHEEIKPTTKETNASGAALNIAEPVALALETLAEFGSMHDKDTVLLIDKIRHHCKDDSDKNKIDNLCSDILMLALSANKYLYLYGDILESVQNLIDTERE